MRNFWFTNMGNRIVQNIEKSEDAEVRKYGEVSIYVVWVHLVLYMFTFDYYHRNTIVRVGPVECDNSSVRE